MTPLNWTFLMFSILLSGSIFSQTKEQLVLQKSAEIYLQNLKKQFDIQLTEFTIETEKALLFDKLPKEIEGAKVLIRNKKELQAKSIQLKDQKIAFFTFDLEKTANGYSVDILDDGILCSDKDGIRYFEYDSYGAGRACEIIFDAELNYQSIDCLLLSTDPEK